MQGRPAGVFVVQHKRNLMKINAIYPTSIESFRRTQIANKKGLLEERHKNYFHLQIIKSVAISQTKNFVQ